MVDSETELAEEMPPLPAADTLVSSAEAKKYWEGVGADEDGMLGGIPSLDGFANISRIDLQGSRNFLAKLRIGSRKGLRVVESALEGGAGIGRVTTGLMLHVARQVDVIEPVAKFTAGLRETPGVRHVFGTGLEDWHPAPAPEQARQESASTTACYDLIWTQWCVGYLTDSQLVAYLERCRDALEPEGGVIVLKENLSTSGIDVFDSLDNSVTRQDRKFQVLFKQAGLRVVRTELQRGFPQTRADQLLPVKMYALKPAPAPAPPQ